MYNNELDILMNTFPNYLGTYSHDEIPYFKNEHFSCIINYHPSNKVGSHWIALYHHPNEKYIRFFDSYGIIMSDEIQSKCRFINKKIQYSTHKIQNLYSSYCGLYCVYFLRQCYFGSNYFDIINTFENNSSFDNDKLLATLL